jgi:hypothetical protein
VSTASDDTADHLVAFGDLLLDTDVEVGRRGVLLGYRSLEAFSTGIFPWRHAVIYVVGSQQFVGYVQVRSVENFFVKAAHQCLVVLFDRHSIFLLLAN